MNDVCFKTCFHWVLEAMMIVLFFMGSVVLVSTEDSSKKARIEKNSSTDTADGEAAATADDGEGEAADAEGEGGEEEDEENDQEVS